MSAWHCDHSLVFLETDHAGVGDRLLSVHAVLNAQHLELVGLLGLLLAILAYRDTDVVLLVYIRQILFGVYLLRQHFGFIQPDLELHQTHSQIVMFDALTVYKERNETHIIYYVALRDINFVNWKVFI